MATYRRVTYEDRCQIKAFLENGFSQKAISDQLGFNKSTICRELGRNSFMINYDPQGADQGYKRRFSSCRRKFLITDKVEQQIIGLLKKDLSPEQISGRLKREVKINVSHETIYQYIYRNKKELSFYLRRHGRRGAGRYLQRKYRQNNRLEISQRPKIVDRRQRIGDWERDGMYGANKQQLLICTERKSRLVLIEKMGTSSPAFVTKLTEQVFKRANFKALTVTNDNGPEFRDSRSLSIPAYHCEPRKPQQRGTVENAVGLLRQYVTRKTDLSTLRKSDLKNFENKLNLRPRRCLDFLTPHEVFFKTRVALVT